MLDLEKLSEYTKAVLAIVIGEHVIKMLPKDEGFLHSRKTLDLCWKCIEKWENIEDDVIDDLCNCICSDNDEEFEYYSKIFHLCGCNMARSGNKATEI